MRGCLQDFVASSQVMVNETPLTAPCLPYRAVRTTTCNASCCYSFTRQTYGAAASRTYNLPSWMSRVSIVDSIHTTLLGERVMYNAFVDRTW